MTCSWYTVKSLLLLALLLEVRTQFFDVFQGFQPAAQSLPPVSTITQRRYQHKFLYSPSNESEERRNGYREPGNANSAASYNNERFPNILETKFENARTTTTTAKPPQRYSSQSANRNNNNKTNGKRRNQQSQEDNSNNFWNLNSNRKKKPSNEDTSNSYYTDIYYAVRPLYKTTKAPAFENDRDNSNTYNNNQRHQRPSRPNNKQTTPKTEFNSDKPSYNNDERTYNIYTTAKPTLNNERTDYSNDKTDYNRQTTVKPSYNNDRQDFNRDPIDYNSYTTVKPTFNNDRTSYNKQTTSKPVYNNESPSFNGEKTNYDSYGPSKPSYDDGSNINYDKPNRSFTTKRPKQNNHRTDFDSFEHNFNSYTTKVYQRPEYERTTKQYNNERPYNTYTTGNPFHNRPGVKPAVIQGPPITNRPKTTTLNNQFGHTEDSILFPENPDSAPQVVYGPDVDGLTEAARRRHIEYSERLCDRYKSLDISQVAAIPLIPAPEPVTFNVTNCKPHYSPLIVGGKVVNIEEFPHNAAIGWQKLEGGGYSWKCGGSLISELFVLTAAHCSFQERDNTVASGPPRVVQLGSSYLDDPGALVMRVTKAIRHPRYKLPRSYYDIALLKLGSAVRFSAVIKPACLGVPPRVGDSIIATGWGRTEFGGDSSPELRGVSVPIWDIDECSRALGTSRKLPDGPRSDSQVCAGELQGMKDTCQGDSGGPAQIQDGCAWRIVGVTSLGRACGAPRTPAIYATVQREFIAAVLEEYR